MTVKSMPEVLASLVHQSIKRLQSNSDASCSTKGPSKKQCLTAQIEAEEDDDNSNAEGLRRRNEHDAD